VASGHVTAPLPRSVMNSRRFIEIFDFYVEFACKLGDQSGLGRIISSIAIDRLRVFTQPRPKGDIGSPFDL
jgi:hypothetical protein